MTFEDFSNLSQGDYLGFDLKKIKSTIALIETVNFFNIKNQNTKENLDDFEKALRCFLSRVEKKDKLLKCSSIDEISLISKINLLLLKINWYRLAVKQQNEGETFLSEASRKADDILLDFNEIEKNVNIVKDDVKKATIDAERQAIKTSLSVMGIFSIVITIVMSVIITSTSWLNNADGASAIIAFLVPSLVITISASLLIGFVLYKQGSELVIVHENENIEETINKHIKRKKQLLISGIIITIVVAFIIVGLLYFELEKTAEPHSRYILSQGMYDIVELTNHESNEIYRLIEFEHNGTNYQIEYNESFIHDGKIYFCEEHQRLE